MPAQPIVNASLLYVNGLKMAWVDTTHITVSAGAARDSTNTNDIVYPGPVNYLNTDGFGANPLLTLPAVMTINAATTGVNGLDTGSLANSTFYAVYVISDSFSNNPTAAILSTGVTGPTAMPAGYDMFRRIGFVKTDGAAHILPFWQDGAGGSRKMWYDAPISVLAATAAAAFTAQSLAVAVPVTVGQTDVTFAVDLLPNAAANFVELRPTGSTAAAGNVKMSGSVAAVHKFDQLTAVAAISAGALSVDWITDAASTVQLSVANYVDSLQ